MFLIGFRPASEGSVRAEFIEILMGTEMLGYLFMVDGFQPSTTKVNFSNNLGELTPW